MATNSSAGRHRVVPWMRMPAPVAHHPSARRCASAKSTNSSPLKNRPRTNGTCRSTRGLSLGWRTRAASIKNLRAWEYSKNVSLMRGSVGSALVMTGVKLSGMRIGNTPPKKAQAASNPAITSLVVWPNVNHTNMWRDHTETTMSAWTTRRRSVWGSKRIPIRPKSVWSSLPGSPSATRTVSFGFPAPHRSEQNRCKVRWGTSMPRRTRKSPILATVWSASTHALISSSWVVSSSHAPP